MPAFLGKLFNLSNRSNTSLSTSNNFSYPSNPPLPRSNTFPVPVSTPGARDSLPPYPFNELPSIGSWPRSRRGCDDANVHESVENPFSDANRASMTSMLRRSRSYASFSTTTNMSGLRSRDEETKEKNESFSGEKPPRRRAMSTTTRPDPSQLFLTRSLKSRTEPQPLSSTQTKESNNGVNPMPNESKKEDKGKGRATHAPTPTRSRRIEEYPDEKADSEDDLYGDYYYSAFEKERESITDLKKKNVGVSREPTKERVSEPVTPSKRDSISKPPLWHDTVNSVIRPPNTEELKSKFSPTAVHDDEEISRALQFYEQYGYYCSSSGARGSTTKATSSSSNVLPVPVPAPAPVPAPFSDKTTAPEPGTETYPASPVSSTTTTSDYHVEARIPGAYPSSSVTRTSSTVSRKSTRTAPVATFSPTSTVPVKPIEPIPISKIDSTSEQPRPPPPADNSNVPPSTPENKAYYTSFRSTRSTNRNPSASSPAFEYGISTEGYDDSPSFVPSPMRSSRSTRSSRNASASSPIVEYGATSTGGYTDTPSFVSSPMSSSSYFSSPSVSSAKIRAYDQRNIRSRPSNRDLKSSTSTMDYRSSIEPDARTWYYPASGTYETPSGYEHYGTYWPVPPIPPPFSEHRTRCPLDRMNELPFVVYPEAGYSVYLIEECENYYYLTFENVYGYRYYRVVLRSMAQYMGYVM